MSAAPSRPFVSAKFTPAGRTHSFLLPEFDLDGTGAQQATPPAHGEPIVVETSEGPAMATVTRGIPAVAVRRTPPEDSAARFVRRATRDDVVARLKHEQREKDAHRICLLKIRERGLEMKLTRVEQLFDGSRLIFYYTAEGRVDFRE